MRKFLPYFLILTILLAGLFGPTVRTQAQEPPKGKCTIENPDGTISAQTNITKAACDALATNGAKTTWASAAEVTNPAGVCVDTAGNRQNYPDKAACESASFEWKTGTPANSGAQSGLYENLPDCATIDRGAIEGCIIMASYYLVFQLPAKILELTAYMFNAMLAITLSSALYTGTFLPETWRIVRDFSSIFFILILLYVSMKMIIGLGGAEIKKIIVQVMVMALLINFSMFFTQVVIDTSNILALIFYNKITITTTVTKDGKVLNKAGYKPTLDQARTGVPEKNFSGAIVEAFDPSRLISEETFEGHKKNETSAYVKGVLIQSAKYGVNPISFAYGLFSGSPVDVGFFLTIIFVSGAVFLYASYAFFMAALSFIGRLIELWMCIIFSPFAFMSLSLPDLRKVHYLGWDAWIKRLTSVAFMAPMFMGFMLFISMIVQIKIFDDLAHKDQRDAGTILLVVIPGIIYCTLLHKATTFAKKGGGEFGEAVVKYGTMAAGVVGGLSLALASGGTSMALTSTLGRAGAAIGNSKFAKTNGAFGRSIGNIGNWIGRSSFDLRKAPGVGKLAKMGGASLFEKTPGIGIKEGGWEKRRKDKVLKRQKRAKELEVGEDEKLKQNLNRMEQDLQEVLNDNLSTIEGFDRAIKDAKEINDPKQIEAAINAKKAFLSGLRVDTIDNTGAKVNVPVAGPGGLKSIIAEQGVNIQKENRRRKVAYAKSLTKYKFRRSRRGLGLLAAGYFGGLPAMAGLGLYYAQRNGKAEREAAHAIIMENKLPDSAAGAH